MRVVSIILVFNEFEKTKKCINSLLKSKLPKHVEHFIIVIDNGSNKENIKKLKEIEKHLNNYKKIIFIYNEKNLGYGGGNNIGIKYALENLNPNALLLINNDAYLKKNTLREMLKFLFMNKKVGIVGPTICYYNNKNKIWHGGGYFNFLKMGISNIGKNKIYDITLKKSKPIKVDFINTCIALIKKDVFEKVGLLDDRFFLYYDDVDFCYRAKKQGFDLLYLPFLVAYHDIDDIHISRATPTRLYYLARSYFIFVKKFFGFFGLLYSIFLFILIYTPFRIFQMIKGKQPIIKGLTSYFKGAINGLFFKL